MTRFILSFTVCLLLLFTLSLYTPIVDGVIQPFTSLIASLCGALMRVFDATVVVEGDVIRSGISGFGIEIVRGCNAVDAVLILTSAILAFPAPLKNKFAGMVLGFIAIQVLNLVRIISLFYLGLWNRVWFDWFHLYLWQALIILDAMVVWLVWLRYLPQKPARIETN